MNEMAELSQAYKPLFELFSGQMQAASDDSTLMLDQDWILQTAAIIAMIRVQNDEIRDVDCPRSMEGIHIHVLNATNHYDDFTTLFAEAIDEFDSAKFEQAAAELILGNESIQTATKRINELTD